MVRYLWYSKVLRLTHQFPIQLGFSSATADFTMQGIEDAAAFLNSLNVANTKPVSSPTVFWLASAAIFDLFIRKRKYHVKNQSEGLLRFNCGNHY